MQFTKPVFTTLVTLALTVRALPTRDVCGPYDEECNKVEYGREKKNIYSRGFGCNGCNDFDRFNNFNRFTNFNENQNINTNQNVNINQNSNINENENFLDNISCGMFSPGMGFGGCSGFLKKRSGHEEKNKKFNVNKNKNINIGKIEKETKEKEQDHKRSELGFGGRSGFLRKRLEHEEKNKKFNVNKNKNINIGKIEKEIKEKEQVHRRSPGCVDHDCSRRRPELNIKNEKNNNQNTNIAQDNIANIGRHSHSKRSHLAGLEPCEQEAAVAVPATTAAYTSYAIAPQAAYSYSYAGSYAAPAAVDYTAVAAAPVTTIPYSAPEISYGYAAPAPVAAYDYTTYGAPAVTVSEPGC